MSAVPVVSAMRGALPRVQTGQPLKRNIERSFYEDGEAMLKVRMKNMAESALKSERESPLRSGARRRRMAHTAPVAAD